MNIINMILRIALAVFAGGVVGFEREHHNRPAGLRTHILVGLGAAIVALIESSNTDFIATMSIGAVNVSVGRMTAQVISGIGFLGAGTILVHKHSITGLTTAASLWTVACLGIAAGYGYIEICLIGASSTLLVLTMIRRMLPVKEHHSVELTFLHCADMSDNIKELLGQHHLRVLSVNYTAMRHENHTECTHVYSLEFPAHFDFESFFQEALGMDGMLSVKMNDD
ncbi:magnesium transporter MgtC [Clostridia bacterium]|nr:magnesium transporter MgtC [Clostridia bacterium]